MLKCGIRSFFFRIRGRENNKIMKFCPTCQTHYDEDILRFCTKDGTPLIDEDPPNFIDKPTESFDNGENEIEEPTVIRRKTPVPEQPTENLSLSEDDAERIVIPTTGAAQPSQQQVRPKQTPPTKYAAPPPKKTNTAKVVFLTIVLTLIALTAVGGAYYFLTREGVDSNNNINLNVNTENVNIDTNMDIDNSLFDPNFNVDANLDPNINANTDINANTKTPTPTRTPTPTPTPDEADTNTNTNTNANTNANTNINANSANTATPRPTPSATATPRPSPTVPGSPVNIGNVNGRAVNLPTPAYPTAARTVQAKGRVTVQVTIDESGKVIAATPVSGHPLLLGSAADAARRARFSPVRVSGKPVKAVGTVVYNFVND